MTNRESRESPKSPKPTVAWSPEEILQIISLIQTYGPPTVFAVETIINTIKDLFGKTSPSIAQDDLRKLISDVIEAKQLADAAAAGDDPKF